MASPIGMNMRMTASIDKFQSSMNAVDSKLHKITKSARGTASGMRLLAGIEIGKLLGSGITKLTATFLRAGRAALSFADTQRKVADQLGKLSSQTGMNVENLQVLQQISEYAGLELGSFTSASQKMSRSLGDAAMGSGLAGKALDSMGLDLNAILRLKPAQQFVVIGRAIASIEDPAKKSAAAANIFGRNGMLMIPMFQNIQENAAKSAVEMEKLGIILSTKQVRNIEAMNDSFVTVYASVKKIGTAVIGNLAPAITAANEELIKFVKNFKYGNQEGGQALARYITNAFLDAGIGMAKWIDYMADAFTTAYNFFQRLFEKLYAFMSKTLGTTKSESAGGIEAEERINHITKHLATLRDNLKQTHEYMDTWGDLTGEQAERVRKYEKEIKLYELQRIDAVKDMNRAEKQYFESKREAIFGQKSLTEMMIAFKQKTNKEQSKVSESIHDLGNSTEAYADATKDITPALGEKKNAVNNVTTALEGMKDATNKATEPADLFGKNVGISGEALRKLALDAEHNRKASEQAARGFVDFRTAAEIAADNVAMASQGMVVGFKDATQVVGSFSQATDSAMDSWNSVADVRMKMFEQMGYSKEFLQRQRDAEQSRMQQMYKNRQAAWTNAHTKRTAAQANYEARKLAGSKSNIQSRLKTEIAHIETAFNGLKGWWEKTIGGSPDTPQAGTEQVSEQKTTNTFLESILDALKKGPELILTSIM